MGIKHSIYWPRFYTATILDWKPLLMQDNYKNIIIESLRFLVSNKWIELNAFVIMSNHIHLIWQALPDFSPFNIQLSFMKYTSHQIKRRLEKNDPGFLNEFKVNKYDREYQIWKRDPLSIELFTPSVFYQKLSYIHENPVRAGLCTCPENYYYSSAKFYHNGIDTFGMLTHYSGD